MLQREPGGELVVEMLAGDDRAVISAVNLAEVVTKLVERGASEGRLDLWRLEFQFRVIPFDETAAMAAGRLRSSTRAAGLSLGDRACLALGAAQECPVVTTDGIWATVSGDVEVVVIR